MPTEEPEELLGLPSELIDRLVEAVDSPYESDWSEVSWYLVFAVGGETLMRILPDTGDDPIPGSIGAEMRKTHEVVSRSRYFDAVRNRLAEIVLSGVREDFLIRSLRDELARELRSLADAVRGNAEREKRATSLRRRAEDPGLIARFRDGIAKNEPEAASMTDDEVAEQLREMAAHLAPITTEAELDGWARFDRWTARIEALISDAIIDDWLDRYSARLGRQGIALHGS